MKSALSILACLAATLGFSARAWSATLTDTTTYTHTRTQTPTNTLTAFLSSTQSPTRTATRTFTPYAGTPTHSPTPTQTTTPTITHTTTGNPNTPTITATRTRTPTPSPTPALAVFSCSNPVVYGDDEAVTATWYDNGPLGMSACHYPDPDLPPYFAAAASHLYDQDLCGACAEVTSKGGSAPGTKLTVQVTDECPQATDPTNCYDGSYHLKLGQGAYEALNGGSTGGALPIEWNLVPCPAAFMNSASQSGTGLAYAFKSGASPGWATLILRDHPVPLAGVAYANGPSGPWTPALWQRSYNGWVPSSGTWNTFYLRVTDVRGVQSVRGPITCCSNAGNDSKNTPDPYLVAAGGAPKACPGPAVSDPLIEDFPNGVSFPSSRAGWYGATNQDVAGPACGSSAHAIRMTGTAPQYNGVDLLFAGPYVVPVPTPINYAQVAGQSRALSFRIKANNVFMNTLQVQMHTFGGAFGALVYLTPSAWVNVTIAAPDHESPGDRPRFSSLTALDSWGQHVQEVTRIEFAPQGNVAMNQPFDFEIDDLRWGVYPELNACQVSSAFGASPAVVEEAYGTGVDEATAWLLIVLSQHCGCSPSQVLAERATRSWGEIAVLYGTTWAAVLDEVDLAATNAGLEPGMGSAEQLLRTLRNEAPSAVPLPTVTPYVPAGPQAVPPPGGGC